MTAGEIVHRLCYRAYTAAERVAHARGMLASSDRLKAALATDFVRSGDWPKRLVERQSTRRFFGWADDVDGFRALFQTRFADELSKARVIADAAAEHEFPFFGETFRFGPDIDWHADPVTGAEWPHRYHRDVPVHGGNVGFGDVKYVWELNRHQFFVDLAKVAFLEGSSRHAHAVHSMLRSWLAAVPYATGVPWACALEPAFRAYSWLWTYHLIRAAGMLNPETEILWLTGLYDHGRFLHRHLEHYSSPYNHLTGEAATLFALGLLLPELREAAAWADRGRKILDIGVVNQFHADGGSVEQSTFYHHATLGFYLLSLLLGQRAGVEFSPRVYERVERALEFSIALVQPDRLIPRIGGADDGKPIRLEHLPFWDFRSYYGVGAVLFWRRDFKFAAGRFWEDAFWLLGVAGLEQFDRLEANEPPRSRALPASGYYVVRSDWSERADYLCFDCGEQAGGLRKDDIPSAAHGHADCLSIVAALGGRPVLIDPGFFCYNGDIDWEQHFRRTPAHNTVSIDGLNQSNHRSKMHWSHAYVATLEAWSIAEDGCWIRGSHDGFSRHSNGVIHRRTVCVRALGYVVIFDEIVGSGNHRIDVNYQFAPGIVTLPEPDCAVFDERYELRWMATVPARASVASGGPGPGEGWIAASLGVREPAPRLRLTLDFNAPRVNILSVLCDRRRAFTTGCGAVRPGESFVLRAVVATSAGAYHQLVARPGAPISFEELSADALELAKGNACGRFVPSAVGL